MISEDAETSSEVQNADVKYGVTSTTLVLPETYGASTTSGTGTRINHYEMGRKQLYGFVDKHEDQVLDWNQTLRSSTCCMLADSLLRGL